MQDMTSNSFDFSNANSSSCICFIENPSCREFSLRRVISRGALNSVHHEIVCSDTNLRGPQSRLANRSRSKTIFANRLSKLLSSSLFAVYLGAQCLWPVSGVPKQALESATIQFTVLRFLSSNLSGFSGCLH